MRKILFFLMAIVFALQGWTQTPATLPYSCDFESPTEVLEWTISNSTSTNKWAYGAAANGGVINGNSLFISNDGTSYNYSLTNAGTVTASRKFISNGTTNYQLSFDLNVVGESTYDYLKVYVLPKDSVYNGVSGATFPFFAVSGFTSPYLVSKNGSSNFLNFIQNRVFLTIPSNIMGNVGDTLQIVFVWKNDASGGTQPPAAIDNISIISASCDSPTALAVPSATITSNSAIVNWTPSANNGSFTLEYKKSSQTWAQAILIQNANSGLTLSTLDPNTDYNIRLKPDCFGVEGIYNLINFKTLCGNITSYPWFEGFENTWAAASGLSNATTPDNCWINFNGGASTSYLWRRSTTTTVPSYVRTGTGAAQFYGANNSGIMGDYLITPVFSLTGDEKINFWAKGYSSTTKYNEPIWIKLHNVTQNGDIQSQTDTTLFIDLAFINDTNQYTWNNYEYSLSNFTGNYRIVFARMGVNPGYNFQMDDLSISTIPSCASPFNIKATNPHSTSVDITFTPAHQTDASWYIYYNNVSTSVWDSVLCTTTNFTLSGLSPNSKYAFAIKTLCGSSLSALSPISLFQTTCAEISTLPWSDSFDTYGTGTTVFPGCWSRNTTYSYYPYVYATNPSSSPGSLYFYTGTTAGAYNIAATPPFQSSIPINTLQAKLKYRNSNLAHVLYLGVMTDPSDASTFVLVDSLMNPTINTYFDYVVSFANYTGTGNYIAFKVFNNGTAHYAYVDDLEIEAIPNCQPPAVFSANNVTSNTIDIVWTPADPSHNMWWLYYKNSDSTHYDSISVTGIAQQHITNLNPNTSYDYYIVTACGSDLSPASFLGSFTTTCYGISQFPYYESFDTYSAGTGILPTCWMRNSSIATAPNISTTNNTPPNSLYFITAAGNRTSAIIVIDSIVPINTLRVKFNMRYTSTSSKIQVGVMTDPNDFSTFVPVGAKQILNQASVWEEKEVLFDNYTGNGRFIALVSSETAASNVYVDDLVIDYIPTCKKPSNLTVTNITISDATISWTPGNSGDLTWYLYYKNINSSLWDSVFVVGAPTYTLSNLSSGTEYELYIKTDCGIDYSEPSLRPYSFITTCGTITSFPYTESFDNWGTGTGKYPRCWSKNSSTYANPYISTTYNSAPGALYYVTSSTNSRVTAILPPVDNSINVNTLMIKFKMYYTSTSTALPIQVGVMTDTTDWTTFTPVGTPQTITAASTWEDKIVQLDTYTGTGKYIALSANAAATKYMRIDDLEVDVIPSCTRPTSVSVSNITTNSAQITWVPDSPSDINFKVYYKKTSDVAWDSVMVASATTATLNNLIHSTNYDIEVRTQCPNGSYSDALSEVFVTACGDIASIPYYESFDNWGTGTGKYPNCWTRNSSATGAPYINTTSYSSPGSLYFYSASGNRTTAILPAIDISIPINTLKLKFKMYYTTIYDGLQVGIMSDTTDITTFTPIGPKQNISTTSVWENKEVSFNDYLGTGRYIAIMSYDTSAANYARIDDLVLDYIPACANPTGLVVDHITANSAILSWKSGNSYDNAWWLYYKPSSSTTYDSIFIVSNPYTLQSLTVDTYYDYYVVTDCGGQLSSPSVTNKFKTACLPITTIPYTESFDNYGTGTGKYPSCWYKISQYSATYPYINTTNFSSPGSLYLYGYNGAESFGIFGPIDNSISLDTLVIKFKMYYSSLGYAEVQVGVMTDPYDASTFVPVGDLQTQIAAGVWEDKEIALASYIGAGRYIALKSNSPSSASTYSYGYVDNVVLDYIPACAKPSNLQVGLLTSTSAQIKWTNGNVNNTAWKLYYKSSTALGYDSVSISTQSPYLLQGLIPQTTYSYYMRTDCGTDVSDPTIIYTFTTPCAEITTLPWVENFETYGSGTTAYPTCWSKITTYSSYPYINTSGFSGNGLYYYATSNTYNIGVTPPFASTLPMNTLRVKFKYKNTNLLDTLKVGVMSNPSDESTWVELARVGASTTSTWDDYEIRFNDYSGTANYIAFRLDYDNRTTLGYLDNVEVSLIPSCSAPINLIASNFDTNKVNISWTNGDPTDNSWWLYYKSSSSLLFDSVHVTAQSPYTLTNLTPSTEYIVYMRTDCGTKLSEASLVSSFYTACTPITTFPWYEGFDASWVNANGIGNEARPTNCWININGGASTTYKWRANTSATYYRTGSGSAQLYATNDPMSDYLISPIFTFTGNERIRFWYKGYQSTALYPENIWIKAYNVDANGDFDADSDTSLFTNVAFLSDTNCYTWEEFEHQLTNLVGNYRLVFGRNNNVGYYFNIDDLTIQPQATCKRPTSLAVSNIQTSSAVITWTSPDPTATSWRLYYKEENATGFDSVQVLTSPTYTLTNLIHSSKYEYYLKTDCSTELSEATSIYTFNTLCAAISSYPWMEGFESAWVSGIGISNDMVPNTCWVNINGGTSLTYKWRKNATTTNPAYARTGSGSAQLYATNDPMGDYLMTPTLTLTGNEQLSFWGKGYSSSTNYPENIWVKAYNVTANGEIDSYSDTTLFTNIYFINDTNQYTWKNYDIPLTNLVGNYRLVFGRNNSVGNYYHIDDLVVDIISACPKPTTISVSNITSSTADIAWTPGTPTDAAWKIYYRKYGTQAWDSILTTATPHTLIGLQTSTPYEVGVATDCGTGQYSNMRLTTFSTACGPITSLPWTDYFDSYGSGTSVFPTCWTRLTTQTDRPYVNTAGVTGNCLYFYANSGAYNIASIPMIDPSISISSLRTTFKYKTNNSSDYLLVGVMTDPTIATSLVIVDTVTAPSINTWYDDTVSFASYTGAGQYISFKIVSSGSTSYARIDNLEIAYDVTCNIPTSLTATNITATSADITWIAGGTETSWQIKQGSTGTPISVTSSTYQATGLTQNTSYTYYVRANCAAGVYSAWTMVTFTTPVMPTNPTVTTSNISTFTHNTAAFNGLYTQGTDAVTAVGFVYKDALATSWTTQTLTSTTSPFSYNASGLTPNTLYKVRAFATTQAGTFYGDTSSFTTLTLNPPTVTTNSVTNVTGTSATFNGTTAPGTESIVSRGFEYKTSAQAWTSAFEVTATGSTTITANVTGLVTGTTYNVRAYAETASGKTYGSEVSFIAGSPVVLGEVTTLGTTNVATTSATLNGSVVNVGGATIGIEVGFVYSTTTNPVINGANVIKVPVTYTTGMINYNSNITGLTDTTQYYVKSYITNSAGTAYGQEMTFITRKSGLNDIDVNSMSVQLYPNPATTEATLVIKGITGKAKIMISDVQGRTINTLETVGVNGEASQKLNLSNYSKGIYYIRIQNAKIVNTQKLIVE